MPLSCMCSTCHVPCFSSSQVMELLNQWDTDRNGLIDKKEFRDACRAMGMNGVSREVLDSLFDFFDDDGSGNLEYREIVMKARRAAFSRGFIPKREAPEPTVARKLDAYWQRRNTRHMQKYENTCIARENAYLARRKAAAEQRRRELIAAMAEKTVATRNAGLRRNEKYWLRREREESKEQRRQIAAEPVRVKVRSLSADEQPVFLPSLPAGRALAKKTWARDPVRERTAVRLEEEREVGRLQDVWVGSIINEWKDPEMEKKAAQALLKQKQASRGFAPDPKHFAKLAREDVAERMGGAGAAGLLASLAGGSNDGGAGGNHHRARVGFGDEPKRLESQRQQHQQPVLPTLQVSSGPTTKVKEVTIDLTPRTIGGAEVLGF